MTAPSPRADAQRERTLDELGMDGKLWAEEFHATAKRLGYSDMNESWLIGWFCNAIMAGFDEAQRRYDPAYAAALAQVETPAPSTAMRVCNKCGYAGPGEFHKRPDSSGEKCPYSAVPVSAPLPSEPEPEAGLRERIEKEVDEINEALDAYQYNVGGLSSEDKPRIEAERERYMERYDAAIDRILAALRSGGVPTQPEAWIVEVDRGQGWQANPHSLTNDRDRAERWAKHEVYGSSTTKARVVPLYRSPPAAPTQEEFRLRDGSWRCQMCGSVNGEAVTFCSGEPENSHPPLGPAAPTQEGDVLRAIIRDYLASHERLNECGGIGPNPRTEEDCLLCHEARRALNDAPGESQRE